MSTGAAGQHRRMLFFSNRSGCLGSLMISAIGTIILLLLTGVID